MSQSTVGFRPSAEERRLLEDLARRGISTSDVLRRGLHLVAHEHWLDQARSDSETLRSENLNDEPDAW
ncbi:hypothetical protein EXU48_06665 [Occultella glacieicola]|uniref:Ribbon-helix-helix protein CopG domain-containing protein n=1 Tax=Occultella glacieicola TaxID=2518684 RepID=A0ABY2E5R4_9MICO|nr:hypothetical protein [Occultella glacieicola]TDE95931.1 hypothetical protein EXU48_06665 [Occultella glacieicola]